MRISYEILRDTFESILLREGFSSDRAALCAALFADASRDGVPSHGLNRFPGFIQSIRNGEVKIDASPKLLAGFSALERYDGCRGPGPLNAHFATNRACELSIQLGIGCVALANTNHWMRAGNYGWQAADLGCVLICFTNGSPVMAPWGSSEKKIGNNPLVIAIPRPDRKHVVLDMAMSQFSWGKLQILERANQQAPHAAGLTKDGEITTDPTSILEGGSALPIGLWKGAGLSLLLDLLASSLANGNATHQLHGPPFDNGVSQLFIAIDPKSLGTDPSHIIDAVLNDLKSALPSKADTQIFVPGERVMQTRAENLRDGIPVDPEIWKTVQAI